MLKFRLDYEYGGTRSKGIERIFITGRYPQYIVSEEENQEEYISNNEEYTELSEAQQEEQRKFEEEYEAYKELNPDDSVIEKTKAKLVRAYREIKHMDFNNVKRIETPSAHAKGVAATGMLIEGDDIGIIEEYMLGTEMSKFLNFDVDGFIEGELVFPPETADLGIMWLYQTHDIAKLENRNNILDYIFDGKSSKNDFLNLPMPVFLRMFPEYLIDFNTWEYNQEGIQHIKQLQKEFTRLCEIYFIGNEGKEPIKVYCELNGRTIEKSAITQARKELKKYVIAAQNVVSEYQKTGRAEADPLEQALLGELYAMITRDAMNFAQCPICGRYFTGKGGKEGCSRYSFTPNKILRGEIQYKANDFFVSYEDAFKRYYEKGNSSEEYELSFTEIQNKNPEEYEKYYYIDRIFVPTETKGMLGADGKPMMHDTVYHVFVADCSLVGWNGKYNKKIREDEIKNISQQNKKRLDAWLSAYADNVYEKLNEIKEFLPDELRETLYDTISQYEEQYQRRYENGEDVAFEYDQLLVNSVNRLIEEVSPKLVKEINFSHKKGKYRIKK